LEAQETRTFLLVDNKQWWVTLSIISWLSTVSILTK
jgi:hypothetical protein